MTRHIVIGDDFRFARKREGTLDKLVRAGNALDYSVERVPSVIVDGIRVSSTAIRDALARLCWAARIACQVVLCADVKSVGHSATRRPTST
jgi:riboflavin kinase/FMN adenylyltransferase